MRQPPPKTLHFIAPTTSNGVFSAPENAGPDLSTVVSLKKTAITDRIQTNEPEDHSPGVLSKMNEVTCLVTELDSLQLFESCN